MAEYTPTEIDAAVSLFVKSSVSVTKDALGPVDLSARFDEVMELFASTLILDPNSLFYLIFLVSNKLCADVIYAVSLVDDVIQALIEIGYPPTKITQTSLLSDAAAHLSVMDTILSQTGTVTKQGPTVPVTPYDRYKTAIKAFTDASLKPNINGPGGTQIVRSAQDARTSAASSLASLKVLYPDILDHKTGQSRVDMISGILRVDGESCVYKSLNLQAFALQRSLRQARGDLLSLQKSLEDPTTSDTQKTSLARAAYLRIIAGYSVVTGLHLAGDPTSSRMGGTNQPAVTGQPAINDTSTVTVASILTSPAPWAVQIGVTDTLILAEDGHTPTTYTIPVSPVPSVLSFNDTGGTFVLQDYTAAEIITTNTEPFTIPALSKIFFVTVDGKLFQGPLVEGVHSADEVVASLQGLTADDASTLGSLINISNVLGAVVLSYPLTGLHNIHVTDSDQPDPTIPYAGHGYLTALGITVTTSTGTVANNKISVDHHLVSLATGARAVGDVVSDINTGLAGYPYQAIAVGNLIQINNTGVGASSITMTAPDATETPPATDADKMAVAAAYDYIGFYVGQTDSSASVSASELAVAINLLNKVQATVVRRHVGTDTEERVRIDSKLSQDLRTLLTIGAGTANTLLEFVPGVYPGTTTGFSSTADFGSADVVAGDQLIAGTQYTVTKVGVIINGVVDGKHIEVTPALPTNLGITVSFEVKSADLLAWLLFSSDLTDWKINNLGSPAHVRYVSSTLELDRLMNPVLGNVTPAIADIAAATSAVQDLRDILQHQPTEIDDY